VVGPTRSGIAADESAKAEQGRRVGEPGAGRRGRVGGGGERPRGASRGGNGASAGEVTRVGCGDKYSTAVTGRGSSRESTARSRVAAVRQAHRHQTAASRTRSDEQQRRKARTASQKRLPRGCEAVPGAGRRAVRLSNACPVSARIGRSMARGNSYNTVQSQKQLPQFDHDWNIDSGKELVSRTVQPTTRACWQLTDLIAVEE